MMMVSFRFKTQKRNQQIGRSLARTPGSKQDKGSQRENLEQEVDPPEGGLELPPALGKNLFGYAISQQTEDPSEGPGADGFVNPYAAASQTSSVAKENRLQKLSNSQQQLKSDALIKDTAQNSFVPLLDDTSELKQPAKKQSAAKSATEAQNTELPNESASRLMTVKAVAAYFSCSVSKVIRLENKEPGFPRSIRIGGSKRWERDEIDHYIDQLSSGR